MFRLGRQFVFGLLFTAIGLCLCAGQQASAQEAGASLGLTYGLSVPDADDTNPRYLFGITGMTSMNASFSFGGYYLIAGTEEGSGGRKFEYSISGLQALYVVPGGQGTTYTGARLGLTKVRTQDDTGALNLIFSPYHWGLVAGHDYPLTSWLVFGFEGSFLHFQASETTRSNVLYTEDAFNVISFMGSLKWRF